MDVQTVNTEPSITPDDALDLLLEWPLVLIVLDGYEPRLAKIVTDTISEQTELTITLMWNYAADEAWRNATWN